jgi:argininosuccinate lyase
VKKSRLWGHAFDAEPDPKAWEFSQSIGTDLNLLLEELEVSLAHARMLGRQGILRPKEARTLAAALERMLEEAREGVLRLPKNAEDIHEAVEVELSKRVGETAGKLHTARSRNDLIATTTRLYTKRKCAELHRRIKVLQKTIVKLGAKHKRDPMPGYTHQQRAQPITLGFHLMSYFWMLQRDGVRFEQAARMADSCPLGSAALAGTPFPIDRDFTSKELGFAHPSPNALDAVSDRDFVADTLHACASLMVHLSRISQDMILWSSAEYAFVSLPASLTTGSSIMPQKRNPDIAELIRGRTARAIGHITTVHAMMKALPMGYNRDTQEDKPPLFDALSLCADSLDLTDKMLSGATFNTMRMAAAAQEGFLSATAIADRLAARGVPFRKAHEMVARLVRDCERRGLTLPDLTPELLRECLPEASSDVLEAIPARTGIESRSSLGGPAEPAMERQLKHARALLRKKGFPSQA